MKRLTLSQIVDVSQIVGTAAVVVSLLFVGLEVRQNTNQARAASLESGFGFVRAVNDLVSTADRADLVLRGLDDFGALSTVERVRFDALLSDVSTRFGAARELSLGGLLPQEDMDKWGETWASILLSPGGREWHERKKDRYPAYIRQEFDALIAEHEGIQTRAEYYRFGYEDVVGHAPRDRSSGPR